MSARTFTNAPARYCGLVRRPPALALLVPFAALVLALPAGGATGKSPGFTGPTTLPGSDGGSEPSLAISTAGVRYASWQPPGEFARSPAAVRLTNLRMPHS